MQILSLFCRRPWLPATTLHLQQPLRPHRRLRLPCWQHAPCAKIYGTQVMISNYISEPIANDLFCPRTRMCSSSIPLGVSSLCFAAVAAYWKRGPAPHEWMVLTVLTVKGVLSHASRRNVQSGCHCQRGIGTHFALSFLGMVAPIARHLIPSCPLPGVAVLPSSATRRKHSSQYAVHWW